MSYSQETTVSAANVFVAKMSVFCNILLKDHLKYVLFE